MSLGPLDVASSPGPGGDDLGVGSSWVGDQNPKLDTVREKAEPLSAREQNTLSDSEVAKSIGSSSLCRGIEIFVEGCGPDAEFLLPVGGEKEISSRLDVFASLHVIGDSEVLVAEQLDKGLDDPVSNAERSAARGEFLKMPPIHVPSRAESFSLVSGRLREELTVGELLLSARTGQRARAGQGQELAVREVKSHAAPPGRASGHPGG